MAIEIRTHKKYWPGRMCNSKWKEFGESAVGEFIIKSELGTRPALRAKFGPRREGVLTANNSTKLFVRPSPKNEKGDKILPLPLWGNWEAARIRKDPSKSVKENFTVGPGKEEP